MTKSLVSWKRATLAARIAAAACTILTLPFIVWAVTTLTVVDSTGNVGSYTSLALGTDGFAVISYQDSGASRLKVAKCYNSGCTLNRVTTVDASANVGYNTSIAVDTNGMPIIAHYDASNGDLRVSKCYNSGCTLSRTTAVDTSGTVGYEPSIAIDGNGFPVVAYWDLSNSDLKVAKCSNSGCTTSTTLTTVDSTGSVGRTASIAIGSDGFPVISYYDSTNADLKVAKCSNSGCTASTTLTTVDSTGNVGSPSSLTIGNDGFPVISYYDSTNADLKVTKCGNLSCTIKSITTMDSAGAVGNYNSIAISQDGFPVISYWDLSNGDLKVAKCSNSGCTASKLRTVDSVGNVGVYSSLKVASDGFPMIAYQDNTNADLRLTHCDRASCLQLTAPSAPTSFTATVSSTTVSLSWTNTTSTLFDHVVIRRSTSSYPSSVTDGTAVTTTSGTTYTDSNLAAGFYFYGIFSVDEDGNVSSAATASAHVLGAGVQQSICTMTAHWKFDTSPTLPVDDTGNGFTGTVSGPTALALSTDVPSTGETDPYSFSFASGAIAVTRPVQDDFTLCAWIKTSVPGVGSNHWDTQAIMHAEAGGAANDFGFGMNSNHQLVFGDGNGSTDYTFHGSVSVNTGQWVHACATRAKTSGSIHMYVNGTQDGSGSGSTTSLTSLASLYIGYGTDGGRYWNGLMDDVRVYDFVLTPAQIQKLATGALSECATSSGESSSADSPEHGGGRRGSPGRGGTAPVLSETHHVSPPNAAAPSAREHVRATGKDGKETIFQDVWADDWFGPFVGQLLSLGIFEGYKDAQGEPLGLYGPGDSITLGQLAKVGALLGNRNVTPVAGDGWAAPYVDAAKALDLTAFLAKIDANAPASRGAVLQTILEALRLPLQEGDLSYTDVPADSPYAKAVSTATRLGIVSGDDGKGTFRPNDPVNRAETAKMIVSAWERRQ